MRPRPRPPARQRWAVWQLSSSRSSVWTLPSTASRSTRSSSRRPSTRRPCRRLVERWAISAAAARRTTVRVCSSNDSMCQAQLVVAVAAMLPCSTDSTGRRTFSPSATTPTTPTRLQSAAASWAYSTPIELVTRTVTARVTAAAAAAAAVRRAV